MTSPWVKASDCSSGECVEVTHVQWIQASQCSGGTCVQVAYVNAEVWIRDSKNPDGPVLRFTVAEWAAFVKGVNNGEFRF